MKKTIWTYIALGLMAACLLSCRAQGLLIDSYRFGSGSSTNPCDPTFDTSSLTNSLIFYLKLDEVSGNRADSWTNALTFTDNATVTSNPGVITNAAQFTAANSEYLSRADGALVSYSGSFSATAWVYLNSTNTQLMILSKGAGAGNREWIVDWRASENNFKFTVYQGGTTPTQIGTSGTNITLNTWYNLTCTYNDSNQAMTLYVNSVEVATGTASGNPINTVSEYQIGAFNGATFFNGRIDETAFWKRILTTNEIAAIYNCGNARTCCDPGFTDP